MVSILNEEIRVIQTSMSHLRRAMSVEVSSGKRLKMEKDYKELGRILEEKLALCEDFKG